MSNFIHKKNRSKKNGDRWKGIAQFNEQCCIRLSNGKRKKKN